jgi:hypothetical protein
MTYEEWIDKFKPIKNYIEEYAPYGGYMFETYGAEREAVRETDPKLVWTIIEGETKLWLMPGKHLVNRLGYMITQVEWEDEDEAILIE